MLAHKHFVLIALFIYKVNGLAQLEEVFAWKKLSFAWPSEYVKNAAIESGEYIPENNLPLGLERWKDKLFVTIPRWKSGVPTSLGYILLNGGKAPEIIPYPNWEVNAVPKEHEKLENDNHIISTFRCQYVCILEGSGMSKSELEPITWALLFTICVNDFLHHVAAKVIMYADDTSCLISDDNSSMLEKATKRVAVDACDRLWVMDTGFVDILGKARTITPSAILIYDLNTDQLIRKYVLDPKVLKEGLFFDGSFFPNIVIDTNKNRCDDAYAYLPDVSSNGLVVYSFKDNKSWRFEHHFFHFDPLQGNFYSAGVNFQWTDGIFGLALGPEDQNGFRTVYFHPSASLNEFSVNSAVLKNETLAHEPLEHIYYLFRLEGCKGQHTQTTASVFDQKSNVLFLSQLNRDGVACWNPRRPLVPENVPLIARHNEKLVFTNEIRVDNDRNLWILSNKMPKFLYDHLNNDEINYRIFRVKVYDVIAGTPCVA